MVRVAIGVLLSMFAGCGDDAPAIDAGTLIDGSGGEIDAMPSIVGTWVLEGNDGVLTDRIDTYAADGTFTTRNGPGTWWFDNDLLVRSTIQDEEIGGQYFLDASTLVIGAYRPVGPVNGFLGSWRTRNFNRFGPDSVQVITTFEIRADMTATVTRENNLTGTTSIEGTWQIGTPTTLYFTATSTIATLRLLLGSEIIGSQLYRRQ